MTPGRWAVVATPGDRYFFVQTNTLHAKNYFEEDVPDDEVMPLLDDFVRIPVAYVRGSGVIVRGRILKTPTLVIEVGGHQEKLTQSVVTTIRGFFKRSRA